MIIPDVKRTTTIMMAKRSPKGESLSGPAPMKAENVSDEDGMPDGRHAASQDVLSAMHEKSPERLMEALANFVDLHLSHNEPKE